MNRSPKNRFANHELGTLALYLLGGDATPVGLEEIAIKANQLAPGRCTWKRSRVETMTLDSSSPIERGFVNEISRSSAVFLHQKCCL